MGSFVFHCDVPHQWIAQRQVGPVSVYCDGLGCHVLCLWHGIPMWQHIGQSTTVTSRHRRDMTSDVKAKLNHNKQTNCWYNTAVWLSHGERDLVLTYYILRSKGFYLYYFLWNLKPRHCFYMIIFVEEILHNMFKPLNCLIASLEDFVWQICNTHGL